MLDENDYLKRIEELLNLRDSSELYMGALSLASSLFGKNSNQVETIKALKPLRSDEAANAYTLHQNNKSVLQGLHGSLRSFKKEIETGLITSLKAKAKGEVLADFIIFAKQALEDSAKDVAAVLACAALEYSLKKFGAMNGLDVDDKDMSAVIAALKSSELVKSPQGKLLQSFATIRNKAFHAQWDRIESAEVQSVIGFVEQFISEKF